MPKSFNDSFPLELSAFKKKMSDFAVKQTPFFFLIDFELQKPVLCTLDQASALGYFFEIKGFRNFDQKKLGGQFSPIEINPVSRKKYSKAYDRVIDEIHKGNTFLLNLTFPSEIKTDTSLEDVFHLAKAPYKLYSEDKFVVYSPECFVKIKDGYVYSYPMKGTIDANVPDAENLLEKNQKEINEHNTIVDLIRNDLSKIAKEVTVTRFRYLDKIKTQKNEIFHTSSEIRGKLPENWKENIGDILMDMLPAGSICGAPKEKTVDIIQQVEGQERGYYTGVFGYFDGENLESAVSIRYLEKKEDKLWYRSGGGITFLSAEEEEYKELIEKIYVPVV